MMMTLWKSKYDEKFRGIKKIKDVLLARACEGRSDKQMKNLKPRGETYDKKKNGYGSRLRLFAE